METLLASLLKQLAEQTFSSEAKTDNFSSLLQPDNILVQSPGMSQWLKINIAQTLNIAANIQFPLPSSYIWQLYKEQIKGPKESAFNKSHLTWKILQLLPGLLSEPEFADIEKYLPDASMMYTSEPASSPEEKTPQQSPLQELGEQLKAFQLAAKIADVYDQYLMYRPDWINAWEQGQDKVDGADVTKQPWQPILWRAIVAFSADLQESPWHRANMHQALISNLVQHDPEIQKPLYVFGISVMPAQQLEILQAISQKQDVYIYWFNPSYHYWADVVDNRQYKKQQLALFDEQGLPAKQKREEALALLDVGNPLLAAWGKPGQDFLSMVSELTLEQDDLFDAPQVSDLLSWVQSEIFELSFRGSRQPLSLEDLLSNAGKFPKQMISQQDNSVEIHAAHSRLRELEVLRDQICYWFDTGKVNSPGDIIVMMPDVASYAPVIEAVFSRPLNYSETVAESSEINASHSKSSQSIPYAISDQTQVEEDTLVQSFLQFMALEHSRLTLTQIFELVKVPEVSARYQLSIEDIDMVQHWCQKAGIRWGWSGEQKQHWQLPAEPQNTWLFGLKRLLSGYGYLAEEHSVASDWDHLILPESEVEGQLTQSLGRFLGFLEDISSLADFCRHSHTLAEKIEEALLVIDAFYVVDSDNGYRLQSLKESVKKLEVHKHQYTGKISQQVFSRVLLETLSQSGVGQRFLAGKLNFCTLMPMRSIPFKHVCILGMNEADYPRQTVPVSFDLMNSAAYRKGDRSRRLDDRYLFLEAILSARKKLYISYIGRSDRNNEAREPSILVTELLDYCQQSVCFDQATELPVQDAEEQIKSHLITWHPLQPWSTDYFFDVNPELLSYDKVMFDLAQNTRQNSPQVTINPFLKPDETTLRDLESQLALADVPDVIDLESLLQFFRNPVKAWFKNTWKTQFLGLSSGSYDQEPLALDALDRYKVTEAMLSGEDTEQVVASLSKAGVLPVGTLKDIELQQLYSRVDHLKSKLASVTGTDGPVMDTQWVHCPLQIAQNKQQRPLNLAAPISVTRSGHLVLFRPGKLNANNRLHTWLSWCVFCAAKPEQVAGGACGWFLAEDKTLCFDPVEPKFARDYLTKVVRLYLIGQHYCLPFFPSTSLSWADKQDIDKTLQTYKGNDYLMGEGSELHNQRVFPTLMDPWQLFTELADAIFQPVLTAGSVS